MSMVKQVTPESADHDDMCYNDMFIHDYIIARNQLIFIVMSLSNSFLF